MSFDSMIQFKDLDLEMTEVTDDDLMSVLGSGPISAFASAFATTAGIGINGLVTGQSTSSILSQQATFGVPAFIGGLLIPGP
jgi:hypothetical protein